MRDVKKEILEKLAEIEEREQVKVLYAVESGSRAWGVESPDSDYDVRFVYVRKKEEYLSLQEKRDVIEWQLDEVLDINGWDLKKTLVQFHKGNATLFEWANSPVVYKTTDEWEEIYKFCRRFFSMKVGLCHYYGTANGTFRQYLQEDRVKYKKYIYALRPLLACKYIEDNGTIPPVKFDDLLKQKLPETLTEEIAQMLEIKIMSDEKEKNPRLPGIQKYIEEAVEKYDRLSKDMPDDRVADWESLNTLFRRMIGY